MFGKVKSKKPQAVNINRSGGCVENLVLFIRMKCEFLSCFVSLFLSSFPSFKFHRLESSLQNICVYKYTYIRWKQRIRSLDCACCTVFNLFTTTMLPQEFLIMHCIPCFHFIYTSNEIINVDEI